MKNILVTGAAGTIGINLISYLLSEGQYDITALELNNKRSNERLNPYKNRINVVYGDVTDEQLMKNLIKDHDYVFHLAGAMPPLCNVKQELCKKVDYEGTKNLVDSIKMYNPKCKLIFPSTTAIYGKHKSEVGIKSKLNINEKDYYSYYKKETEKLIEGLLKNYVICRIPIVIDNINKDIIYSVNKDAEIEVIKSNDLALALIETLKINNEKFNIYSNQSYRINSKDYVIHNLRTYGLSFNFLTNYLFAEERLESPLLKEENILKLNYISGNVDAFYINKSMKNKKLITKIKRILAKPFIKSIERSKSK